MSDSSSDSEDVDIRPSKEKCIILFKDIDHNTDPHTFKKKWGHDPRFEALDRKERETLLNERKISIKEKRGIGISLTQLCPEDLAKALEIVSQGNPTFQATGEEVELDISAQSEFTLWRLKFFLSDDALGSKSKSSSNGCKNTTKSCHAAVPNTSVIASKRKRDICNALGKTAKKRGKKVSS